MCCGEHGRGPDALPDGTVFIRLQRLEGTLLADGNNLFCLVQTYNYESLGEFRDRKCFVVLPVGKYIVPHK